MYIFTVCTHFHARHIYLHTLYIYLRKNIWSVIKAIFRFDKELVEARRDLWQGTHTGPLAMHSCELSEIKIPQTIQLWSVYSEILRKLQLGAEALVKKIRNYSSQTCWVEK